MNSPLAQLEEQVRTYIGYDRVLAAIDGRPGTVAEWPDMGRFRPADASAWEQTGEQTLLTDIPGLVERLYLVRSGDDAQIRVELFVSSRGPKGPLDRMVEMIAATSIGYRAYQPCSPAIGDLCYHIPSPAQIVMVIVGNVFIRLSRTPTTTLDLLPVASSIADYAKANVSPSLAGRTPAIEDLSLTPVAAKVGQDVRIQIRFSRGTNADGLAWELSGRVDPEVVERGAKGADYAVVRIKRPGRIEVPIVVADRRTLLSTETTAIVDATP